MNKSKLASVLLLLTAGGLGGHHIDDFIEKYNLQMDRYPLKIEYKLLENCVSNYKEPISEKVYANKQAICVCGLEETELEYPFELYREDRRTFLNKFEINVRECM